jgi:hypothetical protein
VHQDRHQSNPRRQRLRRALLVVGIGLLPSVLAPAAGRAATVPTGTCVDFLYFDGLDSRHLAGQCNSALTQAGYASAGYDDQSARNEVQRESTDAVFFHAGHSLDYYDATGHTAIALMFESPQGGSNFDALLGDPTASIDAEGPATICNTQNQCQNATLVSYPWASNPTNAKLNLVVLESCATDGQISSFFSIADTAYDFGLANTVVAFSQDVSFPVNVDDSNQYGDGWGNRFWADAAANDSYKSSVIDASNSVGNSYGFGSWVVLNPGVGPQSLYPAQYFVP